MGIFNFRDYKAYLRARIHNMPRKGHGELRRIATEIGVHPTLISQVLSGGKDFTLEQAHNLTEILGLVGSEIEYFVILVQIERAGTKKLKEHFRLRLKKLQDEHAHLGQRAEVGRELTDQEKARYYSDWIYGAVRLTTEIMVDNNQDQLAKALNFPIANVNSVLQFLVGTGLLVEQNGKYKMSELNTFVPVDSPYVRQHHVNWRLKAIEHASALTGKELMFTCPVTLSDGDFARFREELVEFIKRFYETSNQYSPHRLACLNMDWFLIL